MVPFETTKRCIIYIYIFPLKKTKIRSSQLFCQATKRFQAIAKAKDRRLTCARSWGSAFLKAPFLAHFLSSWTSVVFWEDHFSGNQTAWTFFWPIHSGSEVQKYHEFGGPPIFTHTLYFCIVGQHCPQAKWSLCASRRTFYSG